MREPNTLMREVGALPITAVLRRAGSRPAPETIRAPRGGGAGLYLYPLGGRVGTISIHWANGRGPRSFRTKNPRLATGLGGNLPRGPGGTNPKGEGVAGVEGVGA